MSAWKSAQFRLLITLVCHLHSSSMVVFLFAAIPMQTLVTVCWINCSTRKTATDLYLVYRYGCTLLILLHSSKSRTHFILLLLHVCIFTSYVIYCMGPHLDLWLPSFKPTSLNIICNVCMYYSSINLLYSCLSFLPFRLKMILSAWSATTFLLQHMV